MQAAFFTRLQRKNHDARRRAWRTAVSKHERFSVRSPFGVSGITVLAHHVGKFAFGATQSRYGIHPAAIVVTAAEDDLSSVGRPVCAAHVAGAGVGKPQRLLAADPLHV